MCGCGNLLVIAYRELRELEFECALEIRFRSLGTIDAFEAEKEEFLTRIVEVAMWIADHIMSVAVVCRAWPTLFIQTSRTLGMPTPLKLIGRRGCRRRCVSFVLGNPPFNGQSFQTPAQRAQIAKVIDAINGRAGSLEYVDCVVHKAGQ